MKERNGDRPTFYKGDLQSLEHLVTIDPLFVTPFKMVVNAFLAVFHYETTRPSSSLTETGRAPGAYAAPSNEKKDSNIEPLLRRSSFPSALAIRKVFGEGVTFRCSRG
ncbi:hypothetical protein HD597_000310 [Nonomuraea thailandensis]|uniref:Uncharacterized protein n=1 Tax=Nonomuraea thailandensis TaxID=1188745 RepID=A0A9X2JZ23_9ACTN|nr:hypothetical protein [Nonomuraea thailandensis]MCP2353290.1 hypothetical protein [Nonomuraea thailandensis]